MEADSFFVKSVGTDNSVNTYNPSGYASLGSTSWVLGSVSNLTSSDDVNMVFRSYFSGTDIEDYVDNNTSDVDSSMDKGTHSNFSAHQFGPDSIYDRLTEEDTSKSNTTLIDAESFEGTWPPTNWTETDAWNKESNRVYDGTYSADFDGSLFGSSGDLDTLSLNCSDADYIYVDFWWMDRSLEADDFLLLYYNGSNWNTINDLGSTTQEDEWLHYEEKITDSQYFASTFKIRWSAVSVGFDEHISIDLVTVKKEVGPHCYELDLEVQWTSVDYDETNEHLCIYGGTIGSENITVDVWNGTAWNNLFTDLSSGWSNISVSSYLTSSNFTIRFKGSAETGDTTEDAWDIDAVLLHTWTEQYTAEVEFAGFSDTYSWEQLNWTIDSAWTISSVNVTIQVYNYTLGNYPTSGNGYIAYTSSSTPNIDDTKYQLIMSNPQDFRNSTGGWKIKVKGVKSTETEFDFEVDMIEFKLTYHRASSQPFDWFTTLLYVLPLAFVLLFLLALKRKRRKTTKPHIEKKSDKFSKLFGMTHQQMIGKKTLLEIDPTSDFRKALSSFVSEAKNSDESLFILTNKTSTLHSAFSGDANVKFLLLTSKTSFPQQVNTNETLLPATDLSVLLDALVKVQKVEPKKTINVLFDNLSDIILRCGFEKTYKFTRFLLEAISSPKITALFLFNPTAHEPYVSSSIRGLFQIHLAYTKRGPNPRTSF